MAKLAKRFRLELQEQLDLKPRYNFAPSEESPAIVFEGGKRQLEMMKWGITRQWSKEKKPYFITNLKAEKLANGQFKSSLAKHRCLIPADGFYEWKGVPGKKQPYRFTMNDEGLFAFPAIFDEPDPEKGPPVRTFTIFTTEPNAIVAKVHDRMPAILSEKLEEVWLDPKLTDIRQIVGMLAPYPPDQMRSYPVTPVLNSAKFDQPELIKPL